MTNKFIAVANKQEAERAAKYLESLGYVLTKYTGEDEYTTYTKCISTLNGCYYFSDFDGEQHCESFGEEQTSVPDDFEPLQYVEADPVLMNPHTGSVDFSSNWTAEGADLSDLVEVTYNITEERWTESK